MCQCIVILTVLFFTQSNADSAEEQQGYTYNNYFAPSTLNFQDIYSSSVGAPSEEIFVATPVGPDDIVLSSSTAATTEQVVHQTTGKDEFHLDNVPPNYVEFRPKTEPVTTVGPRFILNSSFLKRNDTNGTTSTSTTTEEPDDTSINVLPIKKNYQRGVLDLLFPAVRVKSFKSVFDTFKRLLSHTF